MTNESIKNHLYYRRRLSNMISIEEAIQIGKNYYAREDRALRFIQSWDGKYVIGSRSKTLPVEHDTYSSVLTIDMETGEVLPMSIFDRKYCFDDTIKLEFNYNFDKNGNLIK